MADATRTQSPPAYGLGRVFEAVPVAPPWLGLALALALVAAFLLSELALGRIQLLLSGQGPSGLRSDLRIAIVLLCMVAYLPTAREAALRGFRRDLDALRPVLAVGAAEFERLRAEIGRHDRRLLWTIGIVGITLGLAAPLATDLSWRVYDFTRVLPEPTWHRVATPVIGWLLVSFVHVVLVESRRFSRIGRELVEVDLLDASPLAPFSRQGLRNALLATGFLGLAALLVIDVGGVRPGFIWVLAALYLIVVAVAGAGLVLPVRGLHRRLQERKRAELDWCATELRRARERLAAGAEVGPRLADLAAWRSLVASASEWPFDAPTLLRFALYLAIPLGSWFGGAMMERLVDTLAG